MNDKYLPELARRLQKEGIATGPVENNRLPVLLAGREVMAVASSGTIFLMPETADDRPVVDTYNVVAGISAQVHEYTEAMAAAPRLEAVGLHEQFRLLADFHDIVLGGRELADGFGYEFATWRWNPDHTAVANGNYYHNGYDEAKQDFACRSGLVQYSRQFRDEQLVEMYRCIHETLDSEYPITKERKNILVSAAEWIEQSVDDLEKRVEQSNQRELEAARDQTDGPALEF